MRGTTRRRRIRPAKRRRERPRQYTIRAVPDTVDAALRERARREGKSINQAAIDALREGLGLNGGERVYHDLDDLIGTWVEDPAFDEAIEYFEQIDEDLWR